MPQLLARAAEEVDLPGLPGPAQRLGVHVGQRQHLAGAPVLHDARAPARARRMRPRVVHALDSRIAAARRGRSRRCRRALRHRAEVTTSAGLQLSSSVRVSSALERRREQVALAELAAQRAQPPELVGMPRSPRRSPAARGCGPAPPSSARSRRCSSSVGDGGHEAAVDLERVDREAVQRGQRRVAGAEVVEVQADARCRTPRRRRAGCARSPASACSR